MPEPERWMRAMPCEDGADRPRELRVFISDRNRVVLNTPPGEMASLDAKQIHALKQLLTEAQIEATYRTGGR
jgi:hypothetical protein